MRADYIINLLGCPPLPRLLGYLVVELLSYLYYIHIFIICQYKLRNLVADYPILKLFKPSYSDFSYIVVLRL